MDATETALVVTVPAAEAVVGAWRAELDHAAVWGVPAHVTVLYPFLHPTRVDAAVLARIAEAARTVPRFTVAFPRVEWFDREVVWLAPEPDDGFRALTTALTTAFPGVLPYGGQHGAEPVPHLTVGDHGDPERLTAAERDLADRLPVRAAVNQVTLMAGAPEPDAWRVLASFELGSPQP